MFDLRPLFCVALLSIHVVACSPPPKAQDGSDTPLASAEPTATGSTPSAEPVSAPGSGTPSATASPTGTAEPAPKACTKIGCQSGLTIPIDWGKGAASGTRGDTLTAAKYKIELTVDGKKGQCEVRWPFKTCPEAPAAQCSGEVAFQLETQCKDGGKTSKDMLVGPLRLQSTPAKVSFKMWREKIMVHQQELSPTFKELRPNGPECQPVCQQGEQKVCIGICE